MHIYQLFSFTHLGYIGKKRNNNNVLHVYDDLLKKRIILVQSRLFYSGIDLFLRINLTWSPNIAPPPPPSTEPCPFCNTIWCTAQPDTYPVLLLHVPCQRQRPEYQWRGLYVCIKTYVDVGITSLNEGWCMASRYVIIG